MTFLTIKTVIILDRVSSQFIELPPRSLTRDAATSFSITLMEDISSFATPAKRKRSLQIWVYLELFPPIAWMIVFVILLCIAVCFT